MQFLIYFSNTLRNSVHAVSLVVSKEEVKENDMHIIKINFHCV